MSRLSAETMPAVTVPPRPNGLPMASTQSPTRSAVGVAEMRGLQRLRRLHLQKREVGLVVDADYFGLQFAAVV